MSSGLRLVPDLCSCSCPGYDEDKGPGAGRRCRLNAIDLTSAVGISAEHSMCQETHSHASTLYVKAEQTVIFPSAETGIENGRES